MTWNYHWRSHPTVSQLEQTIDRQRMDIIQLRRKLTNREDYAAKLELALRQRTQTIDDQRGRIEALQERNRALSAEADHLAELFRMS
jgi:hypothetical protein